MKIIGLTGGIGSGKTTVSEILKNKGFYIIDADELSREETKDGGKAIKSITEYFGNDILNENGSLDRKKLGDIVFRDKSKLIILQGITTDIVISEINNLINEIKKEGKVSTVFVDAPLLFECNLEKNFDEIWLVTATLEQRIKRIIKRDNLSRNQILDRIENQFSDDEKIKKSTYVLDNSSDFDYLKKQVDELADKLLF